MNTSIRTADQTARPATTAATATAVGSSRRTYPSREVGIGYGRSSGYGLDRRYTSDWAAPRFRCG